MPSDVQHDERGRDMRAFRVRLPADRVHVRWLPRTTWIARPVDGSPPPSMCSINKQLHSFAACTSTFANFCEPQRRPCPSKTPPRRQVNLLTSRKLRNIDQGSPGACCNASCVSPRCCRCRMSITTTCISQQAFRHSGWNRHQLALPSTGSALTAARAPRGSPPAPRCTTGPRRSPSSCGLDSLAGSVGRW
jgi:hypothetical protein